MADRYVLEHGPAGPRIHDVLLDIYAPFTSDRIAKDQTNRLNKIGREKVLVIWVTAREVLLADDRARASGHHGND